MFQRFTDTSAARIWLYTLGMVLLGSIRFDCVAQEQLPQDVPDPGVELRPMEDRSHFDATHYEFHINLSEPASGQFRAVATVWGTLQPTSPYISLDLSGLNVRSVTIDDEEIPFAHSGGILRIGPLETDTEERSVELQISYGGSPENGLFFGEDANGDPAVFADNWPNRARWWLPSNDHPSDKATVRFEVQVPSGYDVIANGALTETRPVDGGVVWVWETHPEVPIPTYTMVIGVARFERRILGPAACGESPVVPAPGQATDPSCSEISAWALAGGGDYAEERFARGPDMVDFYTNLVGPYPYEKLAHVQSSTRFGGMENSSAIFYARGGWEQGRMGEGVIAHETAHQWFGDAVTPASWYHLWISEGFASYFGPLYFESRDGTEVFRSMMAQSREVATTSNVVGQAIVDSSTNQLFALLNRNNYQKGAWVLHMLRHRLGDSTFFAAARDYYHEKLHRTADTDDVRAAFELAAGEDLESFFRQWVFSPGHPQLEIEWGPDGEDLVASIRQGQPAEWPTFQLEFDLEVEGGTADGVRTRVAMDSRETSIRIPGAADAGELLWDPEVTVLATASMQRAP